MTDFRYFALNDLTDRNLLINEQHNIIAFKLNGTTINTTLSNASTTTLSANFNNSHLNITYTAFEILVGIIAVIGNLMVIVVFKRDRKLRRRTNYYIVSLAVADFLVGLLGVPFAILSSIGQPTQKHACLLSLSTLVILCTISIFCLVAVSVDRYWAILYPMAYSRNVRTKTAIGIISMCWFFGTLVGLLPLFGIHQKYDDNCFFEKVMDYDYLLFLYFATIITPALLLLAFYAHIYRVIVRQIRQIVTMNPIGDNSRRSSGSAHYIHTITPASSMNSHKNHLVGGSGTALAGGTMLRVLGAARKRDVKATQNLSIIVLFFMICWIPLYTINCITAFNRSIPIPDQFKMCCIILTHLNSAVNPILYAYHLKDFRAALKSLILKIFGIDIEQQQQLQHDIPYRLSLASQHRLQSMNDHHKRASLQNRIYVDSPIWLKQQQQLQAKRNSTITCSLNNIHNTVAAVASATTNDISRDMWRIVESQNQQTDKFCDRLQNNHHQEFNINYPSITLDKYDVNENEDSNNDIEDDDKDDNVFLPNDKMKIQKSLTSLLCEKFKDDMMMMNNEDIDIENVHSYDLNQLKFINHINNDKYKQIQTELLYCPAAAHSSQSNATTTTISHYIFPHDGNSTNDTNLLNQKSSLSIIPNINNIYNNNMIRSISCNDNLSNSTLISTITIQPTSTKNYTRQLDNFRCPITNSASKHSNSLFHLHDSPSHRDNNQNWNQRVIRRTSADS